MNLSRPIPVFTDRVSLELADPPPPPGIMVTSANRWDRVDQRKIQAGIQNYQAPNQDNANLQCWDRAHIAQIANLSRYNDGTPQDWRNRKPWGAGAPKERHSAAPWYQAPHKDQNSEKPWATASIRIDQHNLLPYTDPPSKDAEPEIGWLYARFAQRPIYPRDLQPPLHIPEVDNIEIELVGSGIPNNPRAVNFKLAPVPDPIPAYATDANRTASAGSAPQRDRPGEKPWGPAGRRQAGMRPGFEIEPGPPLGQPPKEVIIQETYALMNNVSIYTLPDRVPLWFDSGTISLDVDSYAWRFTGTLRGRTSLQYIVGDESGAAEIEINCNGYQWIMMVESYAEQRQHAAETYSVSAYSRTRYLGAPFAPTRSKLFTSAINAAQIIDEELSPLGFSAARPALADIIQTPDWTIAANSYSYTDKTPIEVISDVVQAAGGIIRPDMASDTLLIFPRYPQAPWTWGELGPAAIQHNIHESQVISRGSTYASKPPANTVLVSGTEAGVAVTATVTGSAGDQPLEENYHPLTQDTQQAAEKGRNLLSDTGEQRIITLDTMLFPPGTAPELAQPGNLLQYTDTDASESFVGLVLAVDIEMRGLASITQRITIERHLGA